MACGGGPGGRGVLRGGAAVVVRGAMVGAVVDGFVLGTWSKKNGVVAFKRVEMAATSPSLGSNCKEIRQRVCARLNYNPVEN